MFGLKYLTRMFWKKYSLHMMISFPLIQFATHATADPHDYLGFVENDTRTYRGYDFYQSFSKIWYLHSLSEHVNLVIYEDLNHGNSSLVKIQYQYQDVYHLFLNSKQVYDREFMKNIVNNITQRVSTLKLSKDKGSHPSKEFSGEQL